MSGRPAVEHGGQVASAAARLGCEAGEILDLSSTLSHFGPDVAEIVATLGAEAVHYPDPTVATVAMAAELEVDPERVILTNGAAEAIAVLAQMYDVGDVRDPEFALYRRYLLEVREGARRWRTNPSSPLGELAAPGDRAEFWDESHYAMATGRWTRGDHDSWRLTSLTKVWRCAGLRLGFVIAPTADEALEFRRRQPEWSVNAIALAAVEPLLALTDLRRWSEAIVAGRRELVDLLRARGLDARESEAGWALVDDAAHLVEPLFRRKILVRELSNYGLPGMLRVAVPDHHGLERLANALDQIDA